MSNILVGILGFAAFATVILSGLADIILAVTWMKRYFTSGVLIFIRHISLETYHSNIPPAALLDESSSWMGAFTFKQLDMNKYGFRRKFLSFAPQPIMHGLIIFDAKNKRVTVKGYLDWFMFSLSIILFILVPFMWLIGGMSFTEFSPLLVLGYVVFFGLLIGILYWIDFYRLTRIGKMAAELWSNKYVEG
jgi:hypothetical protein